MESRAEQQSPSQRSCKRSGSCYDVSYESFLRRIPIYRQGNLIDVNHNRTRSFICLMSCNIIAMSTIYTSNMPRLAQHIQRSVKVNGDLLGERVISTGHSGRYIQYERQVRGWTGRRSPEAGFNSNW